MVCTIAGDTLPPTHVNSVCAAQERNQSSDNFFEGNHELRKDKNCSGMGYTRKEQGHNSC